MVSKSFRQWQMLFPDEEMIVCFLLLSMCESELVL